VLAMAVVPVRASGAPGVAPATTTIGAFAFWKKPRPALLPIDVLLAIRSSPPYRKVCLPLVVLSVSPYVQSGVLSCAVAVMLLPFGPPPRQLPGVRAPASGLQTQTRPVI